MTTRPNGTGGTVTLIDNTYTRDAIGRITAIDGLAPGDDWTYTYDSFDRLKYAINLGDPYLSEAFTYSRAGNLLTRSRLGDAFTYPAAAAPRPHAPLSLGARILAYDANGSEAWSGTSRMKNQRFGFSSNKRPKP